MLILLSPAKKLDETSPWAIPAGITLSTPRLSDQADRLVRQLRELAPHQLASLMGLSDDLALLNAQRYSTWQLPFTAENARPALYTFNGEVYENLQGASLSPAAAQRASQQLRILSGLYGVLRPFDLMQPYRLEMGTALKNARGKDLYAFWGERITDALKQDLASLAAAQPWVCNLASNEYFKVVKTRSIAAPIITPHFKDWQKGQYRIVSFFAKRARGLMTRYLLEHAVQDPEQLLQFNEGGYSYNPSLTQKNSEPVFTRQLH